MTKKLRQKFKYLEKKKELLRGEKIIFIIFIIIIYLLFLY